MAWGSKASAMQLTAIATEQFFNQTPTLNRRKSAHRRVDADVPVTPTPRTDST